MPWWHYLTKNLKKNRTFFLIILGLGCAIPFSEAQELAIKASIHGKQLIIEIIDSTPFWDSLKMTLEKGLKAEISYTVQIVRPAPPLFSFIGDIVLKEITKHYIFYKDFFADVYILREGKDMPRHHYLNFIELLKALQKVLIKPDFNLSEIRNNSPYWLRIQVKLFPYRLKSPLSLIYYFSQANIVSSSWLLIKLQ